MKHYRRTTSRWLISQALCFCLLLQGSGITEALPLPQKQTFVSKGELESAPLESATPVSESAGDYPLKRIVDQAWTATEEAGSAFGQWLEDPWTDAAAGDETPLRVAQVDILPLPPRLMSAFLSASSRGQASPPSPPDLGAAPIEETLPAEMASLLEKSALEQIPLLAGINLISIPEEPIDTDPAAVFAAAAGDFGRVSAYDACDLTDPWKIYDPADAAASDLTMVDHKIGMWVLATAATILPSDGTLPATTIFELCEGWNLIGLPTGEPRHPHAALASIAGKWQRIFGYDAFDSQDPWEVFSVDVPDWANDLTVMQPGRGYWVLATEAATLEIRNQGPPPTVAIVSPADLSVVTEPTEILGTVESDRLDNWTLTSRPIGDGDAVTLATGNAPIAGGTLATFDPTLLLNGLYEFELTATDVQGQQVSESIAVSVEGQMKIGHFTVSFVDLAIPLSGLDIEIVRTYDSRDKQLRDFGVGWSLDIRQGSYRNNRAPGDGWQFQTGFTPCDTVLESKSHLTVVRLSDQEVYRFALRLYSGEPRIGGGCQADARFDFIDGPLPGTTLEILGNDQVFWETGSDRVIDVDTFETYEPEDVRLTTRDGRIFEFDLNDGVTLVEDLNGNQLSITLAGITHSSGKGIIFDRDVEGRIIRITDPLGREMSYIHGTAGDLVTFTDRAGAVTHFTYDEDHRLLDLEDPRGVKPIRNEYDPGGRLVRHIDAFGKIIEMGHDLENRREVVTNRLGYSRVLEYDARGNMVRETDELGHTTIRIFDQRNNVLSETDHLGRITSFTYTAQDDILTHQDPLGNVTRYSYNGRGQPLTVTDPRGGVASSVYDAASNLLQVTDALGDITSFTSDTFGNLLTATDALGETTIFEYDAFGLQTKATDALGNETVWTHDAMGNRLTETRTRTLADGSTEMLATSFVYDQLDRVTAVVAADGSSTLTSYDLLGKVTRRTDQLGRVTVMTFDLMGRLVTTSHPDGTADHQSFDDEGRLVSQTDRGGRITTYFYDPAGRLQTTSYSDGSSTSNTYDAAGQLVATTDARSNTTSYVFDAAGRGTAIIDSLGNRRTFSYDANGNQTTITDAKGATTTFTYDAVNRLVTITHPDATNTQIAYDDLGRRIAETDAAGVVTELGYDALGNLTSVKDALEQTTSYSYDEVGNLLSQTDASGHTTSFEYDRLGRQTARTFPDGLRESMVYNTDGTLASHTDFDGATRTFEYDAGQRLTRRAYPDGSQAIFTYTPTGRRATVLDFRGITSYSYDSRDRLTEKTDPTGSKLSYTYDAEGNRTSLAATVGLDVYTTTYAYDALNRPDTVTGSQGGVTSLGYDANGNQSSLTLPNGVTTSYSYDGLNRLIDLQSEKSIGDLLHRYRYTVGPAGNRTQVDEHDGTSRAYQYDALYRLTQDRVTDLADALVYQRDFTYDLVGNRLTQTIDDGTGSTTIASAYDIRDRLLTANDRMFGWDTKGNLVSETDAGVTTHAWDFENRLTAVTLDDGTLAETIYDADGNRVRSIVTPPGGLATAIDYLVDMAGSLSHVVAEINGGSVQTLYTRVDDQLLGLFRPDSGHQRYYHVDGIGSIRSLSDGTGTITDRYSYTAYGELLEHIGSDPQPYRFAGEPLDPNTGFYYHRARWHDAATGRFLSTDPFLGFSHDPRSLHRYTYAANDPQNLVDPTGLTFQTFVIAVAVRVVLFTMAHPFLAAGIGLVATLLIPQEFSDAFAAASGPYGTPIGAAARGRARFFSLVKSQRFRNFVKHNQSAAGRLWKEMGEVHFEDFIGTLLDGTSLRHFLLKIGKRSADFLWKGRLIEVKVGRSLKGREVSQLEAIATRAEEDSLTFTYQFLEKPTQGTIDKIKALGGEVLWIFD